MGMVCVLHAIAPSRIDEVLANSDNVGDLLENEPVASLDLDKSWHGIHYLLTGETWAGPEPECYLLTGGTEIGTEEVGYAIPRLLSPAQVAQFAQALQARDSAALLAAYDPADMTAADVYPEIWDIDDRDDAVEYLTQYYNELQTFVAAAAEHGNALIVFLT